MYVHITLSQNWTHFSSESLNTVFISYIFNSSFFSGTVLQVHAFIVKCLCYPDFLNNQSTWKSVFLLVQKGVKRHFSCISSCTDHHMSIILELFTFLTILTCFYLISLIFLLKTSIYFPKKVL